MVRLLELTKKHKDIMDNSGVLICVYRNASGYLWSLIKADGGTDLGWSDFNGNCKHSGTFITYEDALEDAIKLVNNCSLKEFKNRDGYIHWSTYAEYAREKHRQHDDAINSNIVNNEVK